MEAYITSKFLFQSHNGLKNSPVILWPLLRAIFSLHCCSLSSQGSAALQDKTRRKESGSEYVTSPPPVSLGRKVEVDLKQKQKKFEGLDRQAQQVISRFFSTISLFNLNTVIVERQSEYCYQCGTTAPQQRLVCMFNCKFGQIVKKLTRPNF